MPSVRVKKGYLSIHDSQQATRPRSQSLISLVRPQTSQPSDDDSPTSLRRSRTRGSDGPTVNHSEERPAPRRSRASSRVSDHILSTTRRSPQLPPARPSLAPGPPRLSDIEESSRPHSFRRRHQETYSVEGQQTELRVPLDNERDRASSSISIALEQLDHDREHDDSLEEHHSDDIVEHLDVIDPQISTVSTLTNAANAIVVPPLSFYSRKPVVVLPQKRKKKKRKQGDPEKGVDQEEELEYEDALDQHVEDVLTKRDQFRRVMQGVWSFVKTPLGIVTAIYGFLVVFWGTGIVFFLAKFINLHNDITQGFWVELCQQVETGLFTATSIGFIPFRIMDTYRICKIWHYKRKIARLRKKAGLPELYDPDDLPDPVYDPNYIHVLSEEEQIDLHYQQHKFMESQTWYRPHGTQTHRAFPIDLALWICVCNDLNSFFQCLLSGTMWGMDRFERPAWTTGTTLPAAFVAGIVAGVLIYWGGRKTRRTKEVEERLRMALQMEHEHAREAGAPGGTPQQPSPDLPSVTVETVDDAADEGKDQDARPAATALSPSVDSSTTETAVGHPPAANEKEGKATATAVTAAEPDSAALRSKETGAEQRDAADAAAQEGVVERDAEVEAEGKAGAGTKTGSQAGRRPPAERRPSDRSLRFADEMIVPLQSTSRRCPTDGRLMRRDLEDDDGLVLLHLLFVVGPLHC
ncbi:hypothetical protein BD414DRAFT_574554 [Trametes punicea]|nr:hypothetical protein BD414DRAFT_574554 [Trametes punicea]